MKIIEKRKFKRAADFDEENDWFNDSTPDDLNEFENNFQVPDFNALQQGEIPAIALNDDNVDSILADNFQEEGQKEVPTREEVEEELIPEEEVVEETEEGIPDFGTIQQALQWAIDNNRVVKITYMTSGRSRSRGGKQLKREQPYRGGGKQIWRLVEPHHMYQAGNGNLILVTYDRSVRHIRAFIVSNVIDYEFTKNRITGKDQVFRPRVRITPKSEKRIAKMNIKENLIKMASDLEEKGFKISASIVKDAERAMNDFKIAQYVGCQGYWLKNRRCWDNCYRHKRATQPGTPAQEVWMECWDEYKDSINNEKSTWAKYASKKVKKIKLTAEEETKWNKAFINKVENKRKEGMSTPEAVYLTINNESRKYKDNIVNKVFHMMDIAETLKNSKYNELSEKMAEVSAEMLKESDFFVPGDVEKEAQFQGGSKGWGPLGRGFEKVKNWWTGEGKETDVVKKIQDVINKANQMLTYLNASQLGPAQAESDTIIIEAGKEMRIAQRRRNPQRPGGKGFMSNEEMQNEAIRENAFYNEETAAQQENVMRGEQSAREEDRLRSDEEVAYDQDVAYDQNTQQRQQQYQQRNSKMLSQVSRQFGKFMKDTQGLIKDLSGYATKGDNYASQALPLLQTFLSEGGQLYGANNYEERKGLLKTSLTNLVTGLQEVLSGQVPQAIDSGLADTSGQIPQAPQSPQALQSPQNLQTSPRNFSQSPNLIDLNNINSYDETILIPARDKINQRLKTLQDTRGKTGSSESNLKIVK